MEQPSRTKEGELRNLPRVRKLIEDFEAEARQSSTQIKKEKAESHLARLRDVGSLAEYFQSRLDTFYDSEDAQTLEEIKKINNKYKNSSTSKALDVETQPPFKSIGSIPVSQEGLEVLQDRLKEAQGDLRHANEDLQGLGNKIEEDKNALLNKLGLNETVPVAETDPAEEKNKVTVPSGEKVETLKSPEAEKLKKAQNAARMALLYRMAMAEEVSSALKRGDQAGLGAASVYLEESAEEQNEKEVSDLLSGNLGEIPEDIGEMIKQHAALRASIAEEVARRKNEQADWDPTEAMKLIDKELEAKETLREPLTKKIDFSDDSSPAEHTTWEPFSYVEFRDNVKVPRLSEDSPSKIPEQDRREIIAQLREAISNAQATLAVSASERERNKLEREIIKKRLEELDKNID